MTQTFLRKNLAMLVLTSLVLSFLPPLPASAGNTLFADISANPSTGVGSLTGVDLSAVVSGTASGDVTYRFDCTSDGSWERTITQSGTSYTAVDLCNYASVGNYTATVKVERENLSFQGTIAIFVQSQSLPTVDIKANGSDGPVTIAYNTAATLSWASTNATACTASGDWAGAKATSGSESTGSLTNSKTYTISCTGAGGMANDSVTVIVQPATAPTVDIKANSSDGPVTIAYNTAATLSWISTNATSCTASSDWAGAKATSGSESTGSLTNSKTYTISCTGAGGTANDSVTVIVQSAAPTVDLKANGSDGPVTIAYNTAATLSWTSSNTTSCAASGDWSGSKAVSGSESTGSLTNSKTYTITCSGSGGTAADSVTVIVQAPPPTVDLKINNSDGSVNVAYNTAATLSWTSSNTTSCAASGDWTGAKATSGSESTGSLTVVKTYTYTISCTGAGGTANDSVSAIVQTPAPTVDIKANSSDGPITIDYNTAATLFWTSSNTTICTASGDWAGAKATGGFESTNNLTSSKTYIITCSGSGGNATDSVIVNVNPRLTLYAALEAIPNTGNAPLNGVDLRTTVTGTATGIISYKFDCTSDGNWEFQTTTDAIQYFVADLCNYPLSGEYRAKTQVQRGGMTIEGISVIYVGLATSNPTPTLFVTLQAQPNSGPAPLSSNLTATVSGTVTGITLFKFDCTSDGVWDNVVSLNSTSANYSCAYSPAGTYIAKVMAERGGLTVWGNSTLVIR
ncbi:MAG: hypothetical protein Q8N65_01620 [bacterium]|nr:hypothetical protein [bacterium]